MPWRSKYQKLSCSKTEQTYALWFYRNDATPIHRHSEAQCFAMSVNSDSYYSASLTTDMRFLPVSEQIFSHCSFGLVRQCLAFNKGNGYLSYSI
jgi:hypothetical protein